MSAPQDNSQNEEQGIWRGWIYVLSFVLLACVFCLVHLPLVVFCKWSPWVTIPLALVTVGIAFVLVIYLWWAPSNLCFTFIDEGRASAVMAGHAFCSFLIQWAGLTLDSNWNVVPLPPPPLPPTAGTPGPRFSKRVAGYIRRIVHYLFGGLRFYGIWPFRDIYGYYFSWTSRQQDGALKAHIKKLLDYILLIPDIYFARFPEMEDAATLPLTIDLLITIRVVNPYKALFKIQSWLTSVITSLEDPLRRIVATRAYKNWITNPKKKRQIMNDALWAETAALRAYFLSEWGIDVTKIQVVGINPPDELRTTTLAAYTASMEADAATERGRGEAAELRAVAEVVKDHPVSGPAVLTARAISEGKATFVLASSPLTNALSAVGASVLTTPAAPTPGAGGTPSATP